MDDYNKINYAGDDMSRDVTIMSCRKSLKTVPTFGFVGGATGEKREHA
jgi:hypothetical protein